jgi:hypothetical protein
MIDDASARCEVARSKQVIEGGGFVYLTRGPSQQMK